LLQYLSEGEVIYHIMLPNITNRNCKILQGSIDALLQNHQDLQQKKNRQSIRLSILFTGSVSNLLLTLWIRFFLML